VVDEGGVACGVATLPLQADVEVRSSNKNVKVSIQATEAGFLAQPLCPKSISFCCGRWVLSTQKSTGLWRS
jgi:hypothetical protein